VVTGLNMLSFQLPERSVSAGFRLEFDFDAVWPGNSGGPHGRGSNLDFSAEVHAMGQRFNMLSIAGGLDPRDLDTVDRVVVQEFLDQWGELFQASMNLLDVARFLKTQFQQTGAGLVRALSVLKDTKPEDLIEQLGMKVFDIIGPQKSQILIGILGEFYCAKETKEIVGRKFRDFLPGTGMGRRWTPAIFDPPIQNAWPRTEAGMEKGPDVDLDAPFMTTVKIYWIGESGEEIAVAEKDTEKNEEEQQQEEEEEEEDTTAQVEEAVQGQDGLEESVDYSEIMAYNETVSYSESTSYSQSYSYSSGVVYVEQSGDINEGDTIQAPEYDEDVVVEAPVPEPEPEQEQEQEQGQVREQEQEQESKPDILRVEITREGQDTVVEEWTREQIAERIRAQWIALIRLSLRVFPLGDVYEATKSLFPDLSEEELIQYIREANEDEARESEIQALVTQS